MIPKELKEKVKKEKNEELDKELADIEIAIKDYKNQYEKGLQALEEKRDSLKYQKELYG